jgi:hypothetical protein
MREQQSLTLEEIGEQFDLSYPCPQLAKTDGETMCFSCHDCLAWLATEAMPSLLKVAKAARALLEDLDDAIAGADLEAWDAPYRIEAPLFRESSDRLREAIRPLYPLADPVGDGSEF